MNWRGSILIILTLWFTSCVEKVSKKEAVEIVKERDRSIFLNKKELLKAAELERYFLNKFHKDHFNGVVLYADSGKIIYQNIYGYKDIRSHDTLTIDTKFQLASVSKPITALGILKLYQDSALHINDPVKKFFPGFPYENITVKLLLTHRSGLPNYMYFSDKYWPRDSSICNDNVIQLMIDKRPAVYYFPDRRYNYSNTNFAILASIIEKVSGMPYEEYMYRKIFAPSGMTNTVIYNKCKAPMSMIANAAIGYDGRRVSEDTYLNGVVGDKGVYSTIQDLYKLDRALVTGKLLNDSTLAQAYTPLHRDLKLFDNYGLGWRIDAEDDGNKIVYHTGWWKGFRSYFIRIPEKQRVLIVLSNVNKRGRFFRKKQLVELMEDM